MDSRPCLVLSSSFDEWQERNGGPKQPYLISPDDASAFEMDGIWQTWEGDDRTIDCVTILTTDRNEVMEPIHDRMPVVLPEGVEDDWLSDEPDERESRCQPYPDDDLEAIEIPTRGKNRPSTTRR